MRIRFLAEVREGKDKDAFRSRQTDLLDFWLLDGAFFALSVNKSLK
jgi:hypothetical protein